MSTVKVHRRCSWAVTALCLQLLGATSGQHGASQLPVWARCAAAEDMVAGYREQCRLVRKALDGDLVKVPPSWLAR